jgi:hypothetical protein
MAMRNSVALQWIMVRKLAPPTHRMIRKVVLLYYMAAVMLMGRERTMSSWSIRWAGGSSWVQRM